MFRNVKTNILYLTLPIAIFAFLFVAPVKGQFLGSSSLSVGYAPTTQSLKLKPGETYKGEVNVWNLSPSTTVYDIIVRGFKQIQDFPGTARIHTIQEEENDLYSAAKWVQVSKEKIELISNQYNKVRFEINVPKDAASGEYHAMIFLVSQDAKTSLGPLSGSISNLGAGPTIFIKVGDKIIEKAEIEYFTTDRKFYERPPVEFLTRYLNKGNSHITPAGDIVISNFLGREVDRITFNSNRQGLLRGNGANYSDEWNHKGIFFKNGQIAIGPMKAQLITTYLSTNPGYAPLSATTTFWVLPWKHILAIILIAGIMYKIIFRKRKKYEKNNRPDNIYANYPKFN